jgi:hypothetical protein
MQKMESQQQPCHPIRYGMNRRATRPYMQNIITIRRSQFSKHIYLVLNYSVSQPEAISLSQPEAMSLSQFESQAFQDSLLLFLCRYGTTIINFPDLKHDSYQ